MVIDWRYHQLVTPGPGTGLMFITDCGSLFVSNTALGMSIETSKYCI